MTTQPRFDFKENPAGYVWEDADGELGVSVAGGVERTDMFNRHVEFLRKGVRNRLTTDMIDTTGTKLTVETLDAKTLNRLADLLSALTGLPFVRKEGRETTSEPA